MVCEAFCSSGLWGFLQQCFVRLVPDRFQSRTKVIVWPKAELLLDKTYQGRKEEMISLKLVTGGYAQGKRDYVLAKYGLREDAVWDAALPEWAALSGETVVMDHFHTWFRNRMLKGGHPEEEITAFLEGCGNCIIISDQVGNGIVPTDSFEREYRERVGRILVRLAGKAEEVERVICGIGQRIK